MARSGDPFVEAHPYCWSRNTQSTTIKPAVVGVMTLFADPEVRWTFRVGTLAVANRAELTQQNQQVVDIANSVPIEICLGRAEYGQEREQVGDINSSRAVHIALAGGGESVQ